ncbi:MAG: LamG domain-containing protein [Gemmatimonadaceae bacterium]|nr:LamG domain-containing protein [Gemmatimonadaceae bacterium]
MRAEEVLHYAFGAAGDPVERDLSGAGHDGRIVGGARRVEGEFGSALELDGTDGHVDCGADPGLALGEAGTIMLWLRPGSPRQGGIVSWSAGPEEADQRLVVSLHTWKESAFAGEQVHEALGTYFADGEHSSEQFRTPEHKPWFPPPGDWVFWAVTFDARTVDYYRDGVAVETRFQTLRPDTGDAALWLGRCVGLGGPGDYYKGLLADVRIYRGALSHREVYLRYMESAAARGKETSHFGSVAIETAVNPEAGTVYADLDYRSLAPMAGRPALAATLLDGRGDVAAPAKVRMAPSWGHAEAVLDVSELPAGGYTLRVEPDEGRAASEPVEWPGRARGWESVRVLNNFCWELLDDRPTAGQSEWSFTNPRRGWVWFRTESEGGLTLRVPGAAPEAVREPGKGGRQEAMRWMEAGRHRIVASGPGTLHRLTVRSVPILLFWHYPHIGPGTGDDGEYLDRHVLGPCNLIHTHRPEPGSDTARFLEEWVDQRGLFALEGLYLLQDVQDTFEDETAEHRITEFLTGNAGMGEARYRGVIIDEFSPGDDVQMFNRSYYDEWTRACAAVLDDPRYTGRFIMPAMGYNMYDFEKSAAFLTGLIEHGSYVIEEHYLNECDTEEQAWRSIHEIGAGLEPMRRRASPGYTRGAIKLLSYLQREIWNPACNFRVFLDMQFEHHATRPEFFGIGGIGAYSSYNCNNEEYVRWVSALMRHYAIEGGTDRLSSEPYEVEQIRNPDFLEGTEGWTLQPAEEGSMEVRSHEGYGLTQERRPHRSHTEMPFLWTRRSGSSPNRFSQEIRNLEAGGLYLVRLWVGDYAELLAGESRDEPRAVGLRVDGAEAWDGWYRSQAFEGDEFTFASYLPPFSADNRYHFRIHQRVFRAQGPTARLVVEDWKSDSEPGGPVGQELMFNMIDVHPYFEAEGGGGGHSP